jgi:2-iminobutanoate/2-iminopropanoate deaminase
MAGEREIVDAAGAPAAVGPYSHAVRAGGLLFCSGQIPLDPRSGELVGDTPAEQARRCLENLESVCTAAGTSLSAAVKLTEVCAAAGTSLAEAVRLTIYTTRLSSFAEINEVYGSFFQQSPPARAAVGVAELPKGALVEIDAVVAL